MKAEKEDEGKEKGGKGKGERGIERKAK